MARKHVITDWKVGSFCYVISKHLVKLLPDDLEGKMTKTRMNVGVGCLFLIFWNVKQNDIHGWKLF